MTERPPQPVGARGAIDLSGFGPAGAGPASPGAGRSVGAGAPPSGRDGAGDSGAGSPLHVVATDDTLAEIISRHIGIPALLVVWTSQHPQMRAFVDDVEAVVAGYGGRLVLISADLGANPGLLQAFAPLMQQAFGQPSVPATFGLLQGQPVPLFPGPAAREAIAQAADQLLEAAVKSGVTGRVDIPEQLETELSPLHQKAFDAIEAGDLTAARAAYEEALAADPKDRDAEVGLAQVALLARTTGVDDRRARAAAAADPGDLEAAFVVADLDLLGGHVDDAFARLLDLVRATTGEDRDRVRARLLELFSVVGNHDERVRRGRTALMNALF